MEKKNQTKKREGTRVIKTAKKKTCGVVTHELCAELAATEQERMRKTTCQEVVKKKKKKITDERWRGAIHAFFQGYKEMGRCTVRGAHRL